MTRRAPFVLAAQAAARVSVMVAVLGLTAAVSAVRAEDTSSLSGRLERVERDLMAVQRQLYRGETGGGGGGESAISGDSAGSLYAQITRIQEDMRDLNGKFEDLSYKIQQNAEKIDRLSKDVDFRLQALEHPAAAQSAAEPPAPAAATTEGVLGELPAGKPLVKGRDKVTLTPPASAQPQQDAAATGEALYKQAFNQMRKSDYAGAEINFRRFLKDNPNHDLAGNAQYWLGESYYVRGQYDQAAVAFADGYKKYRKNPKAPDCLLKLSFSMRKLNRGPQACAALDQMLKEFPTAPKARIDLAKRTRVELKCP